MQTYLISIFLILGALFILIAAIGMLRFGDFFNRLHASTKATSFGVLLLLIGIAIFFSNWIVTLKALLVIVFIYLTAPLGAHSIAKSFGEKITLKKKPNQKCS